MPFGSLSSLYRYMNAPTIFSQHVRTETRSNRYRRVFCLIEGDPPQSDVVYIIVCDISVLDSSLVLFCHPDRNIMDSY